MTKDNGAKRGPKLDRRALIAGAAVGAAGAGAAAFGAYQVNETRRKYVSPKPLAEGEDPEIALSFKDSRPSFAGHAKAPEGAPNILAIILDDVGFADLGCYGGEIRTPHIDALAASGLRYANFRTCAMCSPTRAAFYTGLNHHSAGMGWLADVDSGYPGYRGDMTLEASTIAEVLAEKGWSTFLVGKWHVMNADYTGANGPYHNWPTSRGFERAYWTPGHSTDFFRPAELMDGVTPIEPPERDDYYFTDDITDKAIAYIRTQKALDPDKPFFLTVAHPAAHSPLQTPAVDRDAYKGAYDAGWDQVRAARLERQRAMGLVPETTALPPLSFGADPWDGLSAQQKKVYARYMEVYAGMMTNLDRNVGRLMATLEELGQIDNTLVVVFSDNGGSPEGTQTGTPNVFAPAFGRPPSLDEAEALYDTMGEDETFPHYPMGWACASNTPFRLYKQYAHLGGVADPLIVSWPKRITEKGAIRDQFLHVIDLFPTLLEAAGVERPEHREGYRQKPVEGASALATFTAAAASTRAEQYFELGGQRAYRAGDWRIAARHERGQPFENDKWELYNLSEEINELTDRSAEHPELVEELSRKWLDAADRYNVLPLDDRNVILKLVQARQQKGIRPNWDFRPPIERLAREVAPIVCGLDHTIEIELVRAPGAGDGVLAAHGSKHAGYVLYIHDGRLRYETSLVPWVERIESAGRLPNGDLVIRYEQKMTRRPFDGSGTLYVNGERVGSKTFDRCLFSTSYDGFSLGADLGNQVSTAYKGPNPFRGEIKRVLINIEARPFTPAETANFLKEMGMRI